MLPLLCINFNSHFLNTRNSKKTWQDSFRFDLGVEKGQGLRIGTAAEGLPQLWYKVLRKFRRAPHETCLAIAEAYPSPSALISVSIFICYLLL